MYPNKNGNPAYPVIVNCMSVYCACQCQQKKLWRIYKVVFESDGRPYIGRTSNRWGVRLSHHKSADSQLGERFRREDPHQREWLMTGLTEEESKHAEDNLIATLWTNYHNGAGPKPLNKTSQHIIPAETGSLFEGV